LLQLRAWPRCRTRPRCGQGSHCWQDVNNSSHSSKAVQGAKILVHARLRKSELIHEPCVVKNCRLTVHVIRRTKLPIGDAGLATGNAVRIAGPRPAHSVAHADVDGIRHESEFVSFRSYCHLENLAPDVPLSTQSLASVLIDDADPCNCTIFRYRVSTWCITGLSGPDKYHSKQQC